MILVGQYDSPYVRRVIALRVLGFAYEHDTRSVFADFDAMCAVNPLGRIPSLVLEDGEVLIDSAAILDWLDQTVGAAVYERMIRPAALHWPEWIERCRTQGAGALAALATERWPDDAPLDQAQINTACLLRYVRMADPDLPPPGRFPALDALSARCEALPAFQATWPAEYVLPRSA